MSDPFRVDGPTSISFSGGRTSAYLLWRVLQANGGLPPQTIVCFANTGKEHEATLRFVRDCGQRWSVPIQWVEYRDDDRGHALVDFQTASRDGQPFEAIVRRRRYLPNPVTRFCTSELKIRPMHRLVRLQGWEEWDQLIGIRADEPRRVAKIRARGRSTETTRETMRMPLAEAGIGVHDVAAFWKAQPFDLELLTVDGRTLAGNCDLCFLKPPAQRLAMIKAEPQRAAWWMRMESLDLASRPSGARFCKDAPSYEQLARFAAQQRDLFDDRQEPVACFCGD